MYTDRDLTLTKRRRQIDLALCDWERIIEAGKIETTDKAIGAENSISVDYLPDSIINAARTAIHAFKEYRVSAEYDLIKFKLANDALKIGLWDMDVVNADPINPNNIIIWSQEFRQMLGYTDVNDFPNILKSWSDRLHPDDKDMTLNALASHINDCTGNTPYDIEYRLMLKSGYYRSFHTFGTTLRDNRGVPLRVAGALMDITEKMQMTTNLKHRDLLLSAGIRAAEILLSAEDETSIEAALTAGMELIGVSMDVDSVRIWKNEYKNGKLHFAMANEWLNSNDSIKAHISKGTAFPYANRIGWEEKFLQREYINGPLSEMSPDDRAFFNIFNAKSVVIIPLFLKEKFWGIISFNDCRIERTFPEDEINILGWVSLMIASAVNRGEYSAQLRDAHERTRLLLDAMPLACHLWNKNLTMFDCNEENNRLFNLADKNYVKDHFFEFSPTYQPNGQLSSEKATEDLQKAFENGRNVVDWMHQLKDGTPIPTEITLVRVPYEDDYMVAGYARDLREYNKMMEEIEQSKAQLETANDAKSDFLASMSHEMRTPLNAVIGLSGLVLEMDGLDEEAKHNLEKVYNAGSTLLNIVNDILDISKIEAGKFELIPNEYDIPSLINDTITQNILRIGEKPIEFRLDINADMPTVLYGDDLRIKQILSNLLSNAFKYTREGTVEFGIRSEREKDSEAVWVTAWVKDTGKGIHTEDIDKLFSNYTQVDAKANRKIEGTGLGLPIAKKMLEAMDGEISVESEYGKGSTFTVRFKQKFLTDATIGADVVDNLKNFRYTDNRRKKDAQFAYIKIPYARVLVVDDITTNLDVSKGLMKPYELKIDCVDCGQDAIDAIRTERVKYDAVFMDHMMPEMDGVEAMQHIRAIGTEYAKKIPIIALTANAITGNEEMFINKGFQAFLSKPINLKQLDAIIKRWVRDKSRESAPEENGNDETLITGGDGVDTATVAVDAGKNNESGVYDAGGVKEVDGAAVAAGTGVVGAAYGANGAGEADSVGAAYSAGCASGVSRIDSADCACDDALYFDLTKIPGINVRKGLELYAGMTEIYLPILRSYAANMPEVVDKLRIVTEENLPEYAINVHGLKGSSGGIGAEEIAKRAAGLEKMAKAGDLDGVLNLNKAFLQDVNILIGDIQIWLKEHAKKTGRPRLNTPEPGVLLELLQSLYDYDMSGIDSAMERLENADYETNGEMVKWLEAKITESEFEDAAQRIIKILDSMEVPVAVIQ